MESLSKIREHLIDLYGEAHGPAVFERLAALIDHYRGRLPAARLARLTQRDAILITYGDQVTQPGQSALHSLAEFCASQLAGAVSAVHILPFYPYTSDDGFSVVDYRQVDPALGSWADIARFHEQFLLMFDAVINHISVSSAWFQGYLNGEPRYAEYFIDVPEGVNLSGVVRPRALPLLTPFSSGGQVKNIWTTFSADQVDLNYQNPAVLLDILDVLLAYVEQGAELIRLDAIAYLWKIPGTSCLHLPQTHRVIQLIRAVLDQLAPHVVLVTETNVPHADNLSYFGDGANEAQMVYNFALPPLVLHTLHTENAEILARWAAGLQLPSRRATFFNFLASHDGIGLNPALGILSPAQIDALVARVQSHGGLISYKNNPDGSTSPYEMNVNYFDALNDPHQPAPLALQVGRFMAAQAIMLALVGVPGIYFHSLFGARGWPAGVQQTGHNRTINRQKNERQPLEAELANPATIRHQVFRRYLHLLKLRAAQPAFDPYGQMTVLDAPASLFALLRSAPGASPLLVVQNITSQPQPAGSWLASQPGPAHPLFDLVTNRPLPALEALVLQPYQTLWLTGEPG